MSRRLHPSAVIAEEAQLLLSAVESLARRRGLMQADRPQLWLVLSGLREIRDRHRANLDLPSGLSGPDGSGGPTVARAEAHHADADF
jgi:hypothetical protein